jgi:hypothetical protein
LYSQIPELQSNTKAEDATPLTPWGEEQLLLFAEAVERFPDYSSEAERVAKQGLIFKISEATTVFSHENIFVCFLSWLVCLGVLVSIGTWMMLRTFPTLKMDSVLVSTIVATPIVGPATLVAIARQRNKPNQP